jgi:signal transduction histidine kinase
MSHELRTPLNAITGFSELMIDGKAGPISAEQADFLSEILKSSEHLLALINDILDLAKVEAGKMEFYAEPVSIKKLTGEVTETFRAIAAGKKIVIRMDVATEIDQISTDPAKLKQILYNYLSNALKFTPEEGTVLVRARGETSSSFRIEVEDTGIGIREEDIEKLFSEFQQLDSGLTKKRQGTGLGLALCKRMVEAQGGSVGVRSTFGKGSVFHIILPFGIGEHPVVEYQT